MNVIASRAVATAREGLQKTINLYSEKRPKLYTDIIGHVLTDNQKYMEVAQVSDFGMATPIAEGTPVAYDDITTPYTKQYSVIMRAIGFKVSEQAKVTDIYNIVSQPAAKIALAMDKTQEQVAANIINLMTSTATANLGPDAKALAATDHPLATGTGANRPATDLALSASALAQAVQELMKQKSHRGDPLPAMGPFYLYVPPDLADVANRIVNSRQQQGTANNDTNWVGGRIAKICVNPYFTSSTAWALRSTENAEHGLFMLKRIARQTKSEYDINVLGWKIVTFEEYVCGNFDWRGFWGTTGA